MIQAGRFDGLLCEVLPPSGFLSVGLLSAVRLSADLTEEALLSDLLLLLPASLRSGLSAIILLPCLSVRSFPKFFCCIIFLNIYSLTMTATPSGIAVIVAFFPMIFSAVSMASSSECAGIICRPFTISSGASDT